MRTIYLDYNATTPLDSEVKKVMMTALDEDWGNPSSVHHVGQRARALLDDARDRVAATLKCKPSEIIFTSGGSESTNLALLAWRVFCETRAATSSPLKWNITRFCIHVNILRTTRVLR